MKKNVLIKGYAMVLLSALLYGCMPMITRYLYADGVNRETAVLLRNMLALPVLTMLCLRGGRNLKIPVKALPVITLLAFLGCCITPLLLYGSYQRIATGTATVFHFVYPAVVVLIGLVFLRKKINGVTLLAVILCVGGICLFYDPNEPLDLQGCALALASSVTFAGYVVLLSGFRYKELVGVKLNFYISAICTVLMLSYCLITDKLALPVTAMGWVWGVLLAVVINVGAVALFQAGTVLIGGERASVLSAVEPLTGMILGAILFQEKITPMSAVGAALVMVACVLIAMPPKQKK